MANDTPRVRASARRTDRRPAEHQGQARRDRGLRALTAGGTEGNERLTTLTGLLLIVLLAGLGVTIVRIGQLLWLHLFLGLVLIGPVALKLASTGYRFVRYYTFDAAYRVKGPPPLALRLLAPLVVLFTVLVFATGIALLVLGPSSRSPLLLIHKVTFIAWLVFSAIHVLGHLPEIVRLSSAARRSRRELLGLSVVEPRVAGAMGRRILLMVSLIGGLMLSLALLGLFAAWTH